MSYTPGPWIAEYQGPESNGAYAILTEKGWGNDLPWIASANGTNVSVKDPAEIAANAFLIAAAPELYMELKACIQNLTMAMLVMDAEARAVCMQCITAHKAVLAKAVPK